MTYLIVGLFTTEERERPVIWGGKQEGGKAREETGEREERTERERIGNQKRRVDFQENWSTVHKEQSFSFCTL